MKKRTITIAAVISTALLFGGTVLQTSVSLQNLLGAFSLSIFIGLIAWIYPLINAIRVNPVEAMQGAK